MHKSEVKLEFRKYPVSNRILLGIKYFSFHLRIICIDEELIKKNYARRCFNTDPRIYKEEINHADLKVGDFLEEYYKIINELTNNEESPKKESEVWKLIILV